MATEKVKTALGAFFGKANGMAFGLVLGAIVSPHVMGDINKYVFEDQSVAIPAVYYDEAKGYVGPVPTEYYNVKSEFETLSEISASMLKANGDMITASDKLMQMWDEIDAIVETTDGKITAQDQIVLISGVARELVAQIADEFRVSRDESVEENPSRLVNDGIMNLDEVENLGKRYNFNGVTGFSHPEFKQDEHFDPWVNYQKEIASLQKLNDNLNKYVIKGLQEENAELEAGIEKITAALNNFLDVTGENDFEISAAVEAFGDYSIAVQEVASGPETDDEIAELLGELEETAVAPK